MKTLLHIFFCLLFLISSSVAISQNSNRQQQIDSLKQKFKKDSAHIYRFKFVRPFLSIDNRNSFIKEGPVNVKGFQIGVILKEKHTIGTGVYGLQTNSKQNLTTTDANSVPLKRTLDLNFTALFYRYKIIDRRFFELALPLDIGLGTYRIKLINDTNDQIVSDKSGGTLLTSGGADFIIKPFKWVGLSTSVGYRFAFEKNPNLNFSGAYYSFGLWVDIRQIYRDIRFYGFTRKKYKKNLKAISKNY